MLKGTELIRLQSEQSDTTKAIQQEKFNYVANGISCSAPFLIKEAKGSVIEDIEGNRYLDFYSGIGVLNAGHCPEPVVNAIKAQAEKLIHSCFMVTMYEPYIELAKKLTEITPGSYSKKAMFVNSGAEAVENAVKIARAYTGRQGIIAFESGFHGRTLLTMSLTSKVKPYKHNFGPFAPEVYKAPFPNLYRGQLHVSPEKACQAYLDYFERFFISEVDPSNIAAMILEPVQGEGGFNIPPKGYWQGLKEICHKFGIVLIADEVQTGFARTGKMFAVENFDVEPDLITMAKSIASGMPLSAVVGRSEIMDAADAGRIGGTYGGNPLACEAALATIKFIEEEKLAEKAVHIGEKVQQRFQKIQKKHKQVGDVRNLGAMIGIELVTDPQTKEPNKIAATKIIAECVSKGLLVIGAGIYGNVIRLLPPLVVTDEQLDQALDVLEESINNVLK